MKHRTVIAKLIIWGAICLFPMIVLSQTFKSTHLQIAYEKLQLKSNPTQAKALTIRQDENGTIEHIGIPLFSDEMRTLLPSPIYDYLEFAALDHKYHINENTLQQQNIKFHNGSWNSLVQLSSGVICSRLFQEPL